MNRSIKQALLQAIQAHVAKVRPAIWPKGYRHFQPPFPRQRLLHC